MGVNKTLKNNITTNPDILKNIEILFEDKNIVIINKPAGLVVHPDGRTEEPTLVDWILKNYPKIKEVGEPLRLLRKVQPDKILAPLETDEHNIIIKKEAKNPEVEKLVYRPGIVHRLDRETSGALLICKTQDAFDYYKGLFQDRGIKKVYEAFLYGIIKEEDGIIDRAIARSRKDFRLWSAQRGARGEARDAITLFTVVGRYNDMTYVSVEPKTGRTHQIRVHFKAINHPIVCDSLYAPKRKTALGFKRLALHARSLSFIDQKGKPVVVVAPYPADFEKAIAKFKAL